MNKSKKLTNVISFIVFALLIYFGALLSTNKVHCDTYAFYYPTWSSTGTLDHRIDTFYVFSDKYNPIIFDTNNLTSDNLNHGYYYCISQGNFDIAPNSSAEDLRKLVIDACIEDGEERILTALQEETLHMYVINALSYDWIGNATSYAVSKEYTIESYVSTYADSDGYKALEKGYGIKQGDLSETKQNQITDLMRDFRNFGVSLQNSGYANKIDNNIRERLAKFCIQAGFDFNLAYSLQYYLDTYCDNHIKSKIEIANNNDFYETYYYSNGRLAEFESSTHRGFFYFVKKFYDYDEKCLNSGSLSVDGINGIYVGVVGQINATKSSALNSSLGVGVGKAFMTVLSASTDNLAESVVNSLARDVCWGIMELLEKASESIVDFCPSIDKYISYFGGIGTSSQEGEGELFNLNNLFYYLGAILLVVLTLQQLLRIIINPEEAEQDTKSLIIRFLVLGVGIYWGRTIIKFIYDFVNGIWYWCFNPSSPFAVAPNMSMADRQIVYNSMKLVTYDYFHINWTYAVVGVLFNVSVGFIIIKNVFALLAECIERYIVTCLLYFSFPSALSLGVSKKTEKAFQSYFTMLGTQLFMLFINLYFIQGFVILLNNFDKWADSFYGLIFVISYLKIGQAFDSYLSSLGLSVAHTSGRMANELLGVGTSLLTGMIMLGRTGLRVGTALANGGAKGVGSILSGATTRMDSSSKGVLKAFNLGENLRRGGLRGLSGGSKVDASTMSMLESRRTGLYGLKRGDTFKNALSGSVNGSILNANPELKKQFMDGIKGAKGIGNMVKSADFYGHGGGASITASIKSQNDRMITTSGSLFNDMASVKTSGSTSSARPMLSTTMGDTLYGSFSTRTNCPTGTTFALNKDSIQRTSDGAFFATASEMGLGVDLTKDARVQAHTLDLASNGNELKLSQLESGNILVQRATGKMDSHNNPIFSTEGYIVDGKWREPDIKGSSYTGFTADDFNNGRFADLKPNENATCYAVADFSEIANPESPLFNPSYLQRYAELHSDEGLRQATENLMNLRADYEDTNGKFTEMAERFVEEVNTDGSDASNFFEMAQSISPWEFEDRPSSVAEVEAMISTIKDNELVYAMDSQFLDSDYIHLCDLAHEKESIFTQEQQEIDRIKDVKFKEGTVALYTDTNGGYFANEIHPATVKETGERNDYTVIPLDTSRDLRGDEQHVREWDYRRVNNSPKSKNP